MMRTWIKSSAANALYGTGLDRLVGTLSGGRRTPLVIGYHRVVEDFAATAKTCIPSLLISGRMLQLHLEWIGRRYRFVDLDELGALVESGSPMQQQVAAITFDDGYEDFHDVALPILRKTGVPAALFVVSDLVGTTRAQIHDQLYFLLTGRHGRPCPDAGAALPDITGMTPYQAVRALVEGTSIETLQQLIAVLESETSIPETALGRTVTWEMLARLQRAGVIIGSHTKSHIVMTNEKPRRVLEEAVDSRVDLEQRLDVAVRHFAYPSGVFDATSVNAVAVAGYSFGYTSCTHRSTRYPLLTIPRTLLWEHSCVDSNRTFSGPILSCHVNGAFGLVAGCGQAHGSARARVGSRTGFAAAWQPGQADDE